MMTNYRSFTLVEMIIVMFITAIIFIAFGNVLTNLMRASNSITARTNMRQEGEYLQEIITRHIRNAHKDDGVRIYVNVVDEDGDIEFETDEGNLLFNRNPTFYPSRDRGSPLENESGVEIHYRPSASMGEIVCIGYFRLDENRVFIARNKIEYDDDWETYEDEDGPCFNPEHDNYGDQFLKDFMILNSDLVSIEGFDINRQEGGINDIFMFDITMEPRYGVGGMSSYELGSENMPEHVKSFVVQTRGFEDWYN